MPLRAPPPSPFLSRRRSAVAVLVALLAAGVVGGGLGFASAAEDQATHGTPIPDWFGVPLPRVGDRGELHLSMLNTSHDPPTRMWAGSVLAEFEWVPDRTGPDGHGVARPTNELRVLSRSPSYWFEHALDNSSFFPHAWPWFLDLSSTFSLDPATHELVSYERSRNDTKNETVPGPVTPLDASFVDVSESRSRWFIPTGGPQPFLPCGLTHGLQGRTVATTDPIQLWDRCDLAAYPVWPGSPPFEGAQNPVAVRAIGTGRAAGHDAVIFGHDRALPANGSRFDRYDLLVWFSPEVPYPLRMEVAVPDRPGQFAVVRLAAFAPGEAPIGTGGPTADPPTPLEWAPREVWGPDDTGVVHPFPLSKAFATARENPTDGGLRDYLAAHPEAFVQRAQYEEDRGLHEVRRAWIFWVADAATGMIVCATQLTPRLEGPTLPGQPSVGEVSALAHPPLPETEPPCSGPTGPHLTRSEVPERLPTVASAMALWEQFASPENPATGANAWGFDYGCHPLSCASDRFALSVGLSLRETYGVPEVNDRTVRRTSLAWIGHDGWIPRATERASGQAPHAPGGAPELPGEGAGAAPSALVGALEVRLWELPAGKYAAGAGFVALLAGLLYWLWPALKTGLAFPFYSRIERPRALEHPARAELASLIEARPGIHFEEILRRTGRGRGNIEHHLRKLVEAGVATVESSPGFTCYFPRGRFDRRLMASYSLLKSEAARAVLAAIVARPGVSGAEVAAAVGLSRQATSHHLHRLESGGLIVAPRAGRELRLDGTDLGRNALALGATAGAAHDAVAETVNLGNPPESRL